jgi:tetratricopeptide (TPR) repeat protein
VNVKFVFPPGNLRSYSIALMFMKNGILLLSLFILFSCSNGTSEEPNSLLSQPLFKPLSDSINQQPTAALYFKRGMLLRDNEQSALAEKDFRKAWSLEPSEDHALGLISILRSKNTDAAISFIQEALQKLPNSIALQVSLARGYQQKNEWTKALEVCNAVIAKYPNQLDALELKAELLSAQNKNAEALTTLEQAYQYAPGDPELAHNLAFAYAEAKNAKVIVLCDSLIRADKEGKHAEPYYIKGVYYANAGNNTQAINLFNQAIQHDYYFLDAYMDKGNLQYDNKQYNEALKTFQLATTVSPTFAEAYYWRGKTHEALGNKAEAKLDYQRAYGLDKTLKEAKEASDRL